MLLTLYQLAFSKKKGKSWGFDAEAFVLAKLILKKNPLGLSLDISLAFIQLFSGLITYKGLQNRISERKITEWTENYCL